MPRSTRCTQLAASCDPHSSDAQMCTHDLCVHINLPIVRGSGGLIDAPHQRQELHTPSASPGAPRAPSALAAVHRPVRERQSEMMRVVASACLLAAPAMALPRQLQAACGDDTAGRLEAAVGMDCAGAMAAIPTISGFSGEVCDFDLAVWLTDDVRSPPPTLPAARRPPAASRCRISSPSFLRCSASSLPCPRRRCCCASPPCGH